MKHLKALMGKLLKFFGEKKREVIQPLQLNSSERPIIDTMIEKEIEKQSDIVQDYNPLAMFYWTPNIYMVNNGKGKFVIMQFSNEIKA